MNEAQKTMAGIGMQAAQSGDPLGSMVNQAQDFYRQEPGQSYVQARTMMSGRPKFEAYQDMYNGLRQKVYNGEPLNDEETAAVQYLHRALGQDGQKKGKYDDLITRGETTLDDIAGQAEGMLDSLSGMQSTPLDIQERQSSGNLPGVLEQMRGQFPFEQDVNFMLNGNK